MCRIRNIVGEVNGAHRDGLDIRGTGKVSTRLNFDDLIARSDGATDKGVRFEASLVFDLTRR